MRENQRGVLGFYFFILAKINLVIKLVVNYVYIEETGLI